MNAPDYEERLPVLGVWTTFLADDPNVADAVRVAYGDWSAYAHLAEAPTARGVREPVVRIEVDSAGAPAHPETAAALLLPTPTHMVIATPDAAGFANAKRGESEAVIRPELAADPERLLTQVIDPLTLFLLCRRDRQPVHAAAIVRGGVAIVLAGPSGVGKSTLTYAASRHGFTVLADEPVYVQLEPRLRVWGRRARVHLTPDTERFFPEIRSEQPRRLGTGKIKRVMDTGDGPRCADRACLCVVRRGPTGGPRLEPLDVGSAVRILTERLDPGFDLYADTIGERIAAVAEGGAWTLTLSNDPYAAIPLLDRVAAIQEGPD